jgi:hypothetical protein
MAEYLIRKETLAGIADAIRGKTGGASLIRADEMANAIAGIRSGGGFTNGTEWTQIDAVDVRFTDVCWADGIFLASTYNDGLWYSKDGTQWMQTNITVSGNYGTPYTICVVDGVKFASANKGLWYSTDGKEWVASNLTDGVAIGRIDFIEGVWLLADYNTYTGGLYHSVDGKTWTKVLDGKYHNWFYGGGVFVASNSNGGAYYSGDGETWTLSNITDAQLNPLKYNGKTWVGRNRNDHQLYYSADGKEWTLSVGGEINIDVNGLYYINGIWFSTGKASKGIYSFDGMTWNACDVSNISSEGYVDTVKYINGMYFAFGDVIGAVNIGLIYSFDGITWNTTNIGECHVRSLDYHSGVYVMVSAEDGIYYSKDGISWTLAVSAEYERSTMHDNGIWITNRHYSLDGEKWVSIPNADSIGIAATSMGLYNMARGENTWVACNSSADNQMYYSLTWASR